MKKMIDINVYEEGKDIAIEASTHYAGRVSAMMAAFKTIFEYLYELDADIFADSLGKFIDDIMEGGEDNE